MWKALLAVVATVVMANPITKPTTLVVLDDAQDTSLYDTVLDQLRERDHQVEVKGAKEEFELLKYDELNYDNLIVLPTTKTRSLGNKLSSKKLFDFFGAGGNIMAVTGSSSVPESVRDFASELDIFVSPKGYKVVDHFEKDIRGRNVGPKSIYNGEISANLTSPASAAYLGNSELVVPLVHAGPYSYVYDSRDEEEVVKAPWTTGTQAYLAAGLQANNNARFLWLGNAELINEEYSKWVFQEKSVVRAKYFTHRLQSHQESERLYKVNEPMHYEIALEEWDGAKWGPFVADDVQLEFTMLDPYYRLTMNHTVVDNAGLYTADFTLPDQYGMFTFRTNYRRPGYSFVLEEDVVTIRHIANDEWPRSWEITNSWVYLTSSISVVVAWLAFVVLFIYSPVAQVNPAKKNK